MCYCPNYFVRWFDQIFMLGTTRTYRHGDGIRIIFMVDQLNLSGYIYTHHFVIAIHHIKGNPDVIFFQVFIYDWSPEILSKIGQKQGVIMTSSNWKSNQCYISIIWALILKQFIAHIRLKKSHTVEYRNIVCKLQSSIVLKLKFLN